MKKLIGFAAVAAFSSLMALSAMAGVWKQDNVGWWYDNGNGTYPSNSWQWIDGDNNGTAECYYFDRTGYMLANTTTPDGYKVNALGAWVENGTVKTRNLRATGQTSPNKEALKQYKLIISQASTYNFDKSETLSATGNYKYALVQLQPNDPVQTLLLSQETEYYIYYVRVFQYDPNTKTIRQPSETIQEKKRVLTVMNDGNGLCMHSPFSGAGEFSIYRITLEGDKLRHEEVYNGHFDDEIPDKFKATEIEWYSTGDLSIIDSSLNK